MDVKRVTRGFALAPLPVLAPLMLMYLLAGAPLHVIMQLLLIGYGPVLAIGLPVHLILSALKRQGVIAYLSATGAAVLLVAVVIAAFDRPATGLPGENPFAFHMRSWAGVSSTAIFLCLACFSAALFWMIAVRRPSLNSSKP